MVSSRARNDKLTSESPTQSPLEAEVASKFVPSIFDSDGERLYKNLETKELVRESEYRAELTHAANLGIKLQDGSTLADFINGVQEIKYANGRGETKVVRLSEDAALQRRLGQIVAGIGRWAEKTNRGYSNHETGGVNLSDNQLAEIIGVLIRDNIDGMDKDLLHTPYGPTNNVRMTVGYEVAKILQSNPKLYMHLPEELPEGVLLYMPTMRVRGESGTKAAVAALALAAASCAATTIPEAAINVDGIPLVQNKEGILVPPESFEPYKALPRSSDIFTLTRSDGNPRPLSEGEAFILLYNFGDGNKNDTPYSMHTLQLRARYALGPGIALEALLAGCLGNVDDEMEFDAAGGEVILQLTHNLRNNGFVYLNAGVTGERSNYDPRIGIELSELLLPQVELGGGRRNAWRAGAKAFDSDVAQGHTNFEHLGTEGEHPSKGAGLYCDANLGKAWLLVDYNYFMGKWPGVISEQDQHAGSVLIAIPWNKQGKYQKPLNYFSFGWAPTWLSNLAAPGYDETHKGVVGIYLTKGSGIFSVSGNTDFNGDNKLSIMFGIGTPLQRSYQKDPY
ncbi:hypothetical protein KY360_07375 [Candidatus Woesearchaeota archaeon]|nr:hypothetical protein [Candidatus Woesearchaeota archaeon]